MSFMPTALVLLNVQRRHLEDQPHEREVARNWVRQVDAARAAHQLVVMVQWDGDQDGENPTFSRGWTLFPDFRAEAGDLLIRAMEPDAFSSSELDTQLREQGIKELLLLTLANSEAGQVTAQTARELGYEVTVFEEATG